MVVVERTEGSERWIVLSGFSSCGCGGISDYTGGMASPNRQGETSKQLAGLHANSKSLQPFDYSH